MAIREASLWDRLSFTSGREKNASFWSSALRASTRKLSEQDGALLEDLLTQQAQIFTEHDHSPIPFHPVHRFNTMVSMKPFTEKTHTPPALMALGSKREAFKIQSLLASMGARMNMQVWVAQASRAAILEEWQEPREALLNRLPLNYNEATIQTIAQFDVLWLQGHAIVRAFQIEHTTSIYPSILHMADLLALQPNMAIKLHIVAPSERREKVFQELRRPIFSLLERGPLTESCTFLSYESLRELSQQKHLVHLSQRVLDDYTEAAA